MFRNKQEDRLSKYFTIEQNQAFKVPATVNQIQVLSGCAWLTIAGKDIILTSQQSVAIPDTKDGVVVSAVGKQAVQLELRSQPTDIVNIFYSLTRSIQA